jgi:hypothetical protein
VRDGGGAAGDVGAGAAEVGAAGGAGVAGGGLFGRPAEVEVPSGVTAGRWMPKGWGEGAARDGPEAVGGAGAKVAELGAAGSLEAAGCRAPVRLVP